MLHCIGSALRVMFNESKMFNEANIRFAKQLNVLQIPRNSQSTNKHIVLRYEKLFTKYITLSAIDFDFLDKQR